MDEARGKCNWDGSTDVNADFEIKLYVFNRRVQFVP